MPRSSYLPLHHLLTLHTLFFLATEMYSCQCEPILKYCFGGTYTPDGPYATNLHLLLTNLTLSAAGSPSFFSTASIEIPPSYKITGLAQCQPNSSFVNCSNCLNQAASTAITNTADGCGRNTSASMRYDTCFLRYSDLQSSDAFEKTISYSASFIQDAKDTPLFPKQVQQLLAEIVPVAAKSSSRFAAAAMNDSVSQAAVSALAWCTMDLPSSDCLQCLDEASKKLPTHRIFGEEARVNCIARFKASKVVFMRDANLRGKGRIKRSRRIMLIIVFCGSLSLVIFVTIITIALRKKRRRRLPVQSIIASEGLQSESKLSKDYSMHGFESPLLNLDAIRTATSNFSEENKLGEGGFGVVYKGMLENGQNIAVKRLSRTSKQGLYQIKNELASMAKLQHRNLVRLFGCCLQLDEKLLIYEYLPNTSLDKYFSDPVRQMQLDWRTRYKIIEGVGRGLLYLHEDSHLPIVHRDLKSSNVLLDHNMNPKISDFGIAKIFNADQAGGITSHVAGTFGYMAPEYCLHGKFSPKSDVYSYGVLVLEIIAGRAHTTATGSGNTLDLLSHAWQCWNQGAGLKVVDQSLGDRFSSQEALRCIQIGLLCIQEDPAVRPTMSSLVSMLTTNSAELPNPVMPAFLGH